MVGMRAVSTAVLLLLTFTPLPAQKSAAPERQQPAPAQDMTITSSTELVLVPAVVTDGSGKPLPNLKREDFVLKEQGKEQKIAIFEEVKTTATRPARAPASPDEFSNFSPAEVPANRVTIIALDLLNTPFENRLDAQKQLVKYLSETIETSEPTALLALTAQGIRVIHDFTTDTRVLAAALQRLRAQTGSPFETTAGDESDAARLGAEVANDPQFGEMVEREREMLAGLATVERNIQALSTVDALQTIARAYAGIPGRKSLIWVTAGFPLTGEIFQGMHLERPEYYSQYVRTWQVLSDSNLAVYAVDVRGMQNDPPPEAVLNPTFTSRRPGRRLGTPPPTASGRAAAPEVAERSATLGTLQQFAENTGGKAFYNRNDLVRSFHEAAQDSAHYYLLGFYRDARDTRPGWRSLSVQVRVRGASVRARSGFYVTGDAASAGREDDLNLALASPLEMTALSVTARWAGLLPSKEAGKKRMEFNLFLAADFARIDAARNNYMLLEFAALARTATGETAGQMRQTMEANLKPDSLRQIREHGLTYRGAIEVSPGEYSVRFVVRDGLTGRMGTVTAPLKVAP